MTLRTLFQFLLIVSLSACVPVMSSPTAAGTQPSNARPDLVVSSVYLGMEGIPGSPTNCISAYAPYEIRAIIENRGSVTAEDVFAVEQSTGYQVRIGTLTALQSLEVQIPLNSAGASYTVIVDPENLVAESDEANNAYSYLAPTPTPPALCPPTQPGSVPTLPSTSAPTLPPVISLSSLDGLIYADIYADQIGKMINGNPVQIMQGRLAYFSPNGLQALFERSGDLWLAEPMDNPGINLTTTSERFEQFPQWWAANPAKIVFNSMGINEAQEKKWNHDISGYLSIMNTDGSDYTTLSDVPSYTRPALNPDGKTIAYDMLGQPMLYEIGAGPRPFDVVEYGYQSNIPNAVYTSPVFAPDGHLLTWWVSQGAFEPQRQFSLVMFDLNGKTSLIVHSYSPSTTFPEWLDPPVWSPGGQWLVLQTRNELSSWDLLFIHREATVSQQVGFATNPVWSPDGTRLAYVQHPSSSNPSNVGNIVVMEVPSWNAWQTSLSAGSAPLGWTAPPSQ
ncbi:MAG: hypothetical protein EHM40_08140 [Chloroflexi bacterium]|nr:MAG: hypothetical protein EHM40_08140 [Chloroflexota bacterium]